LAKVDAPPARIDESHRRSRRTTRIPLGRVLLVDGYDWAAEEANVDLGDRPVDRARLRVRTGVDQHDLDLVGEWKVLAVRDLIAALPKRLEAIGRSLEPEPTSAAMVPGRAPGGSSSASGRT
jgi:hypothetical protein